MNHEYPVQIRPYFSVISKNAFSREKISTQIFSLDSTFKKEALVYPAHQFFQGKVI